MKKILILEDKLDQAKTFICFLRKSNKFNLHSTSKTSADKDEYDEIVPSGSNSTFDYVSKYGDCTVGQLTYSKNNLLTFDKKPFLDFIKSINIPIPETYYNKSQLKFYPIFYKSLREEGYAERGILKSKEDANILKSSNVFFQEFIWSKGTYSVGFLADRGKLITHFIQKEILSYPYHGGSGVVLEHIEDKKLYEYTKRIIEKTGYSGWGLTEFKYSNRIEDYVFMEVNAKFWASIKFAIYNNPLILKLLFDIDIKSIPVKTVLYIDRLILSEFSEVRAAIPYLFKSKVINTNLILRATLARLAGKRIKAQRVKLMK
ncbi:MAG: hypothetical protein JXR68_11655 [Bacteroidales bacterium]|nr:hypothetical protein [Bacteroidales bacterium]